MGTSDLQIPNASSSILSPTRRSSLEYSMKSMRWHLVNSFEKFLAIHLCWNPTWSKPPRFLPGLVFGFLRSYSLIFKAPATSSFMTSRRAFFSSGVAQLENIARSVLQWQTQNLVLPFLRGLSQAMQDLNPSGVASGSGSGGGGTPPSTNKSNMHSLESEAASAIAGSAQPRSAKRA